MIQRWSSSIGSGDDLMPGEILVRLGQRVREHPWWQARASLTLRCLRKSGHQPGSRVLDAGCGWGVTMEVLERAGYDAAGLDVCLGALEILDRARPDRRLIEADLTREFDLAQIPSTFDAVLALDVIEHLDDDAAALSRLGTLVRPGGTLVVSVPAVPALYGEFDAIQGHRRRYTAGWLRDAFAKSGLELEWISGWGRCLLPLAWLQRRGTKAVAGEPAWATYERYLRVPAWPFPMLLRAALEAEARMTAAGLGTWGTSLVAVARRPTEPSRARPSVMDGEAAGRDPGSRDHAQTVVVDMPSR